MGLNCTGSAPSFRFFLLYVAKKKVCILSTITQLDEAGGNEHVLVDAG